MPINQPIYSPKSGVFRRLKAIAPVVVVAALFLLGLFALHRLLDQIHLHEVLHKMTAIPLQTVLLASLSTVAGYTALIGYDWSALRYLGKKLPLPIIAFTSFIGFALANTLGVGALSGAAVRYRLYSKAGLDGAEVAVVSAFCAAGFGVGIMAVAAVAVVFNPSALAGILSFDATVIRWTGVTLIVATLALLIYRSRSSGNIQFRNWSIRMPGAGILAGQLGFSILDIGFAGTTLFLLLPESDLHFLTFVAIFALAALAGVISHVPGGIGVFEGVLVAALQFYMPVDAIAAALLAYRVIYYLSPFIVAMILLAGSELMAALASRMDKMQSLATAAVPVIDIVRQTSPVAAAGISFISGLLLLAGSSLPSSPETLEALEGLFPLAFVELSHLAGSVLGVFLIVLAPALRKRVRAALWIIVGMIVAGAMLTVFQNLDVNRSAALGLAAIVLIACRKAFYRKARLLGQPFTLKWFLVSGAAFAAVTWLAFFSFKSAPYNSDLWWQFAFDEQVSRVLRSAVMAAATFVVLVLVLALRPPRLHPIVPDHEAMETTKSVIRAQDNADANFALTGDKTLLFSPSGESFVMYGVYGRSLVALGDPVGPAEQGPGLVWALKDLADTHNRQPVFYQVGEEHLTWYIDAGMSLYKLGEEARVALADFGLEGPDRKALRQSHNRGRRDGLTVELVEAPVGDPLIEMLQKISNTWLDSMGSEEKGFSLGRFSAEYIRQFPIAIVRENGRITAFANVFVTDTRAEATIDLMRHLPDCSRVTMDFLFIELMLALRDMGYREFNLGMAPLSGLSEHPRARYWDRLGTYLYKHAGHFYSFDGLRRFKEKFDPVWSPKYLAAPIGFSPVAASVDIAALISGGVGRLVRI